MSGRTRQPASGESINVGRQRQRMQVFAELVRDTDRNKGNVLYTKDWRLIMLDFTRAFRLQPDAAAARHAHHVRPRVARAPAHAGQGRRSRAAGRHLTPFEVDALMKRRDLIVARFDRLVAQRGESAVLF